MVHTKPPYPAFSPRWNEIRRTGIQVLSEVLQTYRSTESRAHQLLVVLFRNLLQETEYADPTRIRQLQQIRLRKILRSARKVTWWRKYLTKHGFPSTRTATLEDLQKLPPVTRLSFIDIPRSALLARFSVNHRRVEMHRTSGTTGTPFEWAVDKNVLRVETASYLHRAFSWYGVRAENQSVRTFIATFVWRSYGCPGKELHWSPADPDANKKFYKLVRLMRSAALRILFVYPTNLLLFAQKASETGERPPLDLIVTTGQRLDDASRDYIENVLRCRAVSLYGSREFGQMATECPGRKHAYHINCERLYVEITDELGHPLPKGTEGFITITSLENRTMPLIRYQLGDRGTLLEEPCPCGRTLPLLEFFGRNMDFIHFPSGKICPFRQLSPLLLGEFFDAIRFYQVVQPTLTQLQFRIWLKGGTQKEFERKIIPRLHAILGDELKFSFEYPEKWGAAAGRKITRFIPLAKTQTRVTT